MLKLELDLEFTYQSIASSNGVIRPIKSPNPVYVAMKPIRRTKTYRAGKDFIVQDTQYKITNKSGNGP